VVEQQGREVLYLFVIGVLAEVENLRHGGRDAIPLRGLLIAESSVARQCPKGRGANNEKSSASPSPTEHPDCFTIQ
jgi:hypothetical protein